MSLPKSGSTSARRRAVQEQERLLPVLRTDREGQHEREKRRQKRYPVHQPVQVEVLQLRHAFPERVRHAERERALSGDEEIDEDHEKGGQAEHKPGQQLCGEGLRKDRFKTDFTEELPVHQEGNKLPRARKKDDC